MAAESCHKRLPLQKIVHNRHSLQCFLPQPSSVTSSGSRSIGCAVLSGLAGALVVAVRRASRSIGCVALSGLTQRRPRWAVELRAGCIGCAALSGLAGVSVVVAHRACRSLSAALVGSPALAAVRRRLQRPARFAGRCLHRAPLTPCRFVAFGPAAFLMLGESVIMALEKAAGWKAAFAWRGSSVTRCWRVARETGHLGSPARPRLRRPSAADAQRSRDPMRPTP